MSVVQLLNNCIEENQEREMIKKVSSTKIYLKELVNILNDLESD